MFRLCLSPAGFGAQACYRSTQRHERYLTVREIKRLFSRPLPKERADLYKRFLFGAFRLALTPAPRLRSGPPTQRRIGLREKLALRSNRADGVIAGARDRIATDGRASLAPLACAAKRRCGLMGNAVRHTDGKSEQLPTPLATTAPSEVLNALRGQARCKPTPITPAEQEVLFPAAGLGLPLVTDGGGGSKPGRSGLPEGGPSTAAYAQSAQGDPAPSATRRAANPPGSARGALSLHCVRELLPTARGGRKPQKKGIDTDVRTGGFSVSLLLYTKRLKKKRVRHNTSRVI
ncbi:hypothetical protein SKAU_G00110700 [Synaphobranchus kaupii]|uniref:Uncharacterized protein n=1 Tax=Synaphobranchus kaupii TaxID=118154 RepID=A0A9Q1J7B0_SYNKA|nr:hypothetical protein SKAU_G00110700 [Synaphobranchus kaupii]